MSGIFGDIGPEFGLDDAKVADWIDGGTYGTAVDVPSVQLLEAAGQTVNAQLEGDDEITDTHAIKTSAQIRMRFGSVALAVLEVITGKTVVHSVISPSNDTYTLKLDNLKFPYFGLCGRAFETDGGGDAHLFIPKVKVMEGFTIGFQYGQYVIPEITALAVKDFTHASIVEIVEHESAVSPTLPPNYGNIAP